MKDLSALVQHILEQSNIATLLIEQGDEIIDYTDDINGDRDRLPVFALHKEQYQTYREKKWFH